LFDYPTVDALASHLGTDVLVIDEASKQPDEQEETDLLESIESLSDEEVDLAFGQELESR
jgi:DNA replication protein DnaC